ncbi:hypothetical protein [Martelella radicis]|uniref:Uncharacterized protein n=1 Tax=Martelella radicis TaxID=1397476 RepID=A0A7W6KN77_9HYPH|nr:hypothetical protein [Martelella radicis]MBB4122903.1 hypothetical protein [Martelella radicis]
MRSLPPSWSGFWPFPSAARARDGNWWAAAPFQAEDAGTELTLGAAAVMDFAGNRYALTDGWWELPAYAASDAGKTVRQPAAIFDFSGDSYAG